MKNINNIEIKISNDLVDYKESLKIMEKRVVDINLNNKKELIWFLYHDHIYTIGTSGSEKEIREKITYPVIKTNRGGKITYHGPGQLICYLVIDLKKRNKDIRKFISIIEKSIIDTIKFYKIDTFADKKNIGIWFDKKNKIEKVAAIGVRVSKWIAYHGFSINIDNDLSKYDSIIPCGIKDKSVTNLTNIKKQNYKNISDKLIENLILNLKN